MYVKSYYFSETPEVDHEFTVYVVIGNKGQAEARNFFWEWWPTSAGRACKEEVDVIWAGGVRTVECDYTYSDHANYSTKVIVDSEYDVDESNEYNNISTRVVNPIHEEEKPDLYVSALSFNHNPVMGEEFRVRITIKNRGGETSEHSDWEWWATISAPAPACDGEIGGLDAGESDTVNCDYTYGGWANYTTKAIVDKNDDVNESNEGNNTYTKTVMPIH
ncbi:MAG: CARDB domain-containing protein [Patescibacteria group bacterium]